MEFVQLLESVGLCLVPNVERFYLLFLHVDVSPPLSLSFLSETLITHVRLFLVFPYVFQSIHIFYQYFFLSCSDCIVSIYLSANLLTLLFVILILLLSLFSQLFIMEVYFLISIILFWFLICVCIFVATFYFYIFFKIIYDK